MSSQIGSVSSIDVQFQAHGTAAKNIFLTLLLCVYRIQMGTWATFMLGISGDLFNCALHGFSEEGIGTLLSTGQFTGSASNRLGACGADCR